MGNYFGEFIRELRKDRKLSLRDVGKKTKISNAYLSQVECGKRGIPSLKIIVRLAEVYGVPVSMLIKKAEAEFVKYNYNLEEKESMPYFELSFLLRGYNDLSESKKRSLKDFFFYLQTRDEA